VIQTDSTSAPTLAGNASTPAKLELALIEHLGLPAVHVASVAVP
jgi:hypothetical protein